MTLPANAQHRIGMAGGLNLARFDTELTPGEKLSNYTGIGLGGILDLRLANNIALRLQPMYLQKGAKLESDELPEVEVKFKLSYVELPVLLKLALGKGASQPYLLAGPAIGFLSSAKIAVKTSEIPEVGVDAQQFFKDIDFNLAFGAGLSFAAGRNAIFVEGRYALGIANIAENITDEQGSVVEGNVKTRGIQIMAGVLFPLGRQ
jgi:hypothetical protein